MLKGCCKPALGRTAKPTGYSEQVLTELLSKRDVLIGGATKKKHCTLQVN